MVKAPRQLVAAVKLVNVIRLVFWSPQAPVCSMHQLLVIIQQNYRMIMAHVVVTHRRVTNPAGGKYMLGSTKCQDNLRPVISPDVSWLVSHLVQVVQQPNRTTCVQ